MNPIKKILFSSLTATKGFPLRTLYSGKVQILMLHRVVEEIGENRISNHGIEITKKYLHFLINFYLKNGFSIASINELESILSSKNKKRSVIFTFDDGYLDNYTLALPVFQQYNIPFAVYVPLDFIKRKQFGWWYLIEDLIRTKSTIQLKGNGGKVQNVYYENLDSETNFSQLRTFIQKNPCAIADLIDKSPVDVQKYYDLFLTEKQLMEFSTNPLVTIGSHSISHPSLSKISDADSLIEISKSKTELEKILGKKVDHFSYPFGTINDVSAREIKNVESAGYKTAITTSYGDVFAKSNLFCLPRIWTSVLNNETELKKAIYGINAYNLRKI